MVRVGESDAYWKVLYSGPVYHSPIIHLGLERCTDAKPLSSDVPRVNCAVPVYFGDGEFEGVRYFTGAPNSCVLVPLATDQKTGASAPAPPVVSSSRSLLQSVRDRAESGDSSRSWSEGKATQTDPFPPTASGVQQSHVAVNTELVVVETLDNERIGDGWMIVKERFSAVDEFERVVSGLLRSFTFLELPDVSNLHRFAEKTDSIDSHLPSLEATAATTRTASATPSRAISGFRDWAELFLESWNRRFPNPTTDRGNWVTPQLARLRSSTLRFSADSPTEKSLADAEELEEAAKRMFFHSEELTAKIQGHSDEGSVDICELLMKEKVSTLTETQKLVGDFLSRLQSVQRQASIPWDHGRAVIGESIAECRALIERCETERTASEDRAQALRQTFEAVRLKTSASSAEFSAQLDATRHDITDAESTWKRVWESIASLVLEAKAACVRQMASFRQAVELIARKEDMLYMAAEEEEALQVEYANCILASKDLTCRMDSLTSALNKGPLEVSLVALEEETEKHKMEVQGKLFDSGLKLGVLHESVCRELCFTLHDLRWKKNWVAQSLESKLALTEGGQSQLSPEERLSIRQLKDSLLAECTELDREMSSSQEIFDRLSKPLLKQTNRFRGEIQLALIEKDEAKQLKLLQITEELHSAAPSPPPLK
jgi:hypothetical protein